MSDDCQPTSPGGRNIRPQATTAPERRSEDSATAALATLGAAVAFIGLVKEWSILSSALGIVLLLIILAGHRPQAGPRTLRAALNRTLFGATAVLAFLIIVACPLQGLIFLVAELYDAIFAGMGAPAYDETSPGGAAAGDDDPSWDTTVLICLLWAPLALLVAAWEPRISRALDRDRPARRRRKNTSRPS